ncbi:MAG TPA: hypothetical protein VF186_04350 [Gaiellaceae bacterium]|jgi:hypothetical protein
MTASPTPARFAVLLGGLAVLAIPAAVAASRYTADVTLLHALYASVPAAFVLGLIAWTAARRAAWALARSVRQDRAGPVRLGRFLAWAGMYVAVTGGLALAVYFVLLKAQ